MENSTEQQSEVWLTLYSEGLQLLPPRFLPIRKSQSRFPLPVGCVQRKGMQLDSQLIRLLPDPPSCACAHGVDLGAAY